MSRRTATPFDADVLKGAATEMARNFAAHLANYDERKYPPPVLRRLRLLFGEPETFQPEDIALALRWKFGHLGKQNYPEAQQKLVRRIATLWPAHRIRQGEDPGEVLARWKAQVGPTSYITICFLLHLVSPSEWPILDQHNFRAVRHLLGAAGLQMPRKAAPSTANDLALVRDFIVAVRGVWPSATGQPAPSDGDLDRYLMMFGKSLKAHPGVGMLKGMLGYLFKDEPQQWGLRGDPYLWRTMRQHFSEVPLPLAVGAMEHAVGEAFRALTGRSIFEKESFAVEEFAHGGMSSGGISPEFWRDEALPMLRRRFAESQS